VSLSVRVALRWKEFCARASNTSKYLLFRLLLGYGWLFN
jgi:hypothetical protein